MYRPANATSAPASAPTITSSGREVVEQPADVSVPAPDAALSGAAQTAAVEDPAAKRQRTEGAEDAPQQVIADPSASTTTGDSGGTALADDDSAANLEASLQSCTAHRDRILAMLAEEPDNRNLIELRDQLTNAINQLQGTKNMVQLAKTGRPAGVPLAGQPMAPDGSRPAKGHSSRKNKPQRCSVCGGIGHKSRTCSMAVAPNVQQMCQPVQWATSNAGAMQTAGMPPGAMAASAAIPAGSEQMYAAVGGGYVMVNGQQNAPMQPMSGQMAGNMQPGQMTNMMGQTNMVQMQQMPQMQQQQQMMQASVEMTGGMQMPGGAVVPMAATDGAPAAETVIVPEATCCSGSADATSAATPAAIPAESTPISLMPAAVSATLSAAIPDAEAAGEADCTEQNTASVGEAAPVNALYTEAAQPEEAADVSGSNSAEA